MMLAAFVCGSALKAGTSSVTHALTIGVGLVHHDWADDHISVVEAIASGPLAAMKLVLAMCNEMGDHGPTNEEVARSWARIMMR